MRTWLAVALLSASWLFGLGYFGPVSRVAWVVLLAVAIPFLGTTPLRFPSRRARTAGLLLALLALLQLQVPHLGIPLLLALGLAVSMSPLRSTATRVIARGSILGSLILLPQAFALAVYQQLTARAHELPGVLARPLAALLRWSGSDTVADRALLAVREMGVSSRLALTWELSLDPTTLGVVVGGATMLGYLAFRTRPPREAGPALFRAWARLAVVAGLWIPVRCLLLVALVLQQQWRADVMALPNTGQLLVSPWLHTALGCGLAALLGLFIRLPGGGGVAGGAASGPALPPRRWRFAGGVATVVLAAFTAAFLHYWTPVGQRKAGRVTVVERHSTWEPTTRPYRTELYGEGGSYNYAAIYEYCEQYYTMSRILADDPIDDAALAHCDVLIIKTPTSRYAPEEVAAVERFVEQGGSLLLIGDHTNVFNMNTYLNDVARRFGLTFRNDLLFRIGDPYKQSYQPPRVAHPVVQYVPPMQFAVSCSIDPGSSAGTMVVRNVGLWSLPPAYQETNYHPQAEYRPYLQYGAWCQLWATTAGRGRVLAFADSTLFSNFCVYQAGKSELFVGMLEWLNHASPLDTPRFRRWADGLSLLAVLLAGAGGVWNTRRRPGAWLVLLAAACAGWSLAAYTVMHVHRAALPLPERHRSLPHVVVDRTLSTVPLFAGAFPEDEEGGGYGLLEQWIPRIGNYTSRRSGPAALQGDGLVVVCPTRLPGISFRDELIEWVRAGGRLVVFDTPDVEESTANSLLMLFGLTSVHNAPEQAGEPLRLSDGSQETPLQAACEIQRGEPLATWGPVPVAARIRFGEGWVTAVGFGSLFNDASMGYHWLQEPDEVQLARYEILYALLRAGLQNP